MPDRTFRRPADHDSRRRAARLLRSALWRSRFALAAVCCGLAAAVVVQGLRPTPPPTLRVLVAAHALVAGEPVEATDVTTRRVAADLVPDGVLTAPEDAVGLAPAVDLPAGMPLHADLVVGGSVVARAPEGTVVVPVHLDETSSAWLRPGDRVDLLAVGDSLVEGTADDRDGDRTQDDDGYLARRALVLPAPAPVPGPAGGGLLGGGGATAEAAGLTLVAVDPQDAPALTSASGWGSVGAVLVR